VAWRIHHAGYKAGVAEITAKWQTDTAKRDKADADERAREQKRYDDAVTHGSEVLKDANEKLLAIAADRDSLGGMLRRAQDGLRRAEAAAHTNQLGADVVAGIASRASELEAAFDNYDRACQRDAVRFHALQEQVRPWMQ
jgi:hypothetical protein